MRSLECFLDVNHMFTNLEQYCSPIKRKRAPVFKKAIVKFFQDIEGIGVDFNKHIYFDYLKSTRTRRPRYLIKDAYKLYFDIKKNGIKDPLELHWRRGKLRLWKGARRLVIAHILEIQYIKARIYIIERNQK